MMVIREKGFGFGTLDSPVKGLLGWPLHLQDFHFSSLNLENRFEHAPRPCASRRAFFKTRTRNKQSAGG